MAPHFIERMQRQHAACEAVFGQPTRDPPSYAYVRNSYASSESSGSLGPAPSFLSRYHRRSQDLPQPLPPPPYCPGDQSGAEVFDAFALPKWSLVLVTGANGRQGMHVVDQLLERGYRVRGTVRDAEKAIWTGKYFREKYGNGRYMPVVIPDMAPKGAFDIAIRGCSGVIHLASVMTSSTDPYEVITPTIAGAINALESAAKEFGVKRFVYCSALAAAVSTVHGTRNEVTSDSWNMAAFEKAWDVASLCDDTEKASSIYSSSKMQAELVVWRWYRDHKPQFVLNSVLPASLLGKALDQEHRSYGDSASKLITTAYTPQQQSVQVQDCALLHVAALLLPDLESQRIFAVRAGDDCTFSREASKAVGLLQRLGRKGWTGENDVT